MSPMPIPVPPCRVCGAEVAIDFSRGDLLARRECTDPGCPSHHAGPYA